MCRRRNHRIENHRSKSLRTLVDAELRVKCFRMGNCMTAIKYLHRIFAVWDGEPAFCEIIVSSSMAIIISDIYDQQERFMANMFGFPYFKESSEIQVPGGKGGYWYRLIDSTNPNNGNGC